MSKETKEQKLRTYLNDKVNPVFERLIVELLISTPNDFIEFSVNWLQDKGRKIANGEKVPRPQSSMKVKTEYQESPESEMDEDDDEEPMDEEEFAKLKQKKQNQNMRESVSSEVYGAFNKKQEFKPQVIQKSEEQKSRIYARLGESFMFQYLDEKDQEIVVNAMEEVKFGEGDIVIKQNDDGDCLYLVDSGELDCFKQFNKDEEEKYLKTYHHGEAFGELALLYNAPRAATIKAKTESVCFKLDRNCFNHVVKESSTKRREKYEAILSKVELLNDMDSYEKTQLCDGIKEIKIKQGETIIKEGDVGDKFYMVHEGSLAAYKVLKEGEEPQEVLKYHEGDYFGEIALLKDIPRQATVKALEDSSLVYLDKGSFKRLLGPIEDLLQRNSDKYQKFMNQQE
ncbi:Cyclic nucleotide-binding protein [Pseudocohnilembus persalinus]|uniref:cAMP-dependent protein kinase regulatory subunit n=1 Tax=Pseudocohnilembus persalinus TaxID=266149 RepID=A0A0V0QLV0_PSEPJ|nr:Cyclic nucleotide-binding protein [Pseudocohnilembus persalinus]|eukprot:KRX03064.1 Cyclic nucleotide-binding protein [Pseudocohnilembus persalinus]